MKPPKHTPTTQTTPPNTTHLLGAPLALALALTLLTAPPSAHAWEFNSVLWNDDDTPIPLELHNDSVDGVSVAELETVVQNVVATWNQVPCAWIKLTYIGTTDHTVQTDDRQTLEFIKDPERWVYGSMSAGAMIADVYDPPETPERESPRVDIAFNAIDFQWKIGGSGDPRNIQILDPEAVLTHEVGHLLGLGHTRDTNAATMAPAYIPDLGQITPAWDDKAGLCTKYPLDAPPECTTNDSCPNTHTCVPLDLQRPNDTPLTTSLCSEPHGSFGDPCSGNQLNCVGFCRFTTNDLSQGYCSDLCDPEDSSTCPDRWLCVDIGGPFQDLFACQPDPDAPPEDAGCCQDTHNDTTPNDDATSNNDATHDHDTTSNDTASPDTPDTTTPPNTTPPNTDDGCSCTSLPSTPNTPSPTLPILLLLSLLAHIARTSSPKTPSNP